MLAEDLSLLGQDLVLFIVTAVTRVTVFFCARYLNPSFHKEM